MWYANRQTLHGRSILTRRPSSNATDLWRGLLASSQALASTKRSRTTVPSVKAPSFRLSVLPTASLTSVSLVAPGDVLGNACMDTELPLERMCVRSWKEDLYDTRILTKEIGV